MSDFLVIPLLPCPFLLWPYTQHPRQTRPSSLKGTIFTFHPCTPQSLGQPALLRSPPSTPGSFAPSTPGRQLNGHLSDALNPQTRSLICMESPASLSSSPQPTAGLARDGTQNLGATLANPHGGCRSHFFFKTSETWSNFGWRDHNLLPRPTRFFSSCSAEQAVPRNLRNQKFLQPYFSSQHFC